MPAHRQNITRHRVKVRPLLPHGEPHVLNAIVASPLGQIRPWLSGSLRFQTARLVKCTAKDAGTGAVFTLATPVAGARRAFVDVNVTICTSPAVGTVAKQASLAVATVCARKRRRKRGKVRFAVALFARIRDGTQV